jgi:hypothetical protein
MIMLKKLYAVLTIIAVGMFWTASANAGCVKIGGTTYCSNNPAITTGSEVFNVSVTGLGNIKDNCPTGDIGTEECPITAHYVLGTIPPEPGGNCKPTVIVNQDGTYEVVQDPTCTISGQLFCVNKPGNARNAEGQPFLISTPLSNADIISSGQCTKNGKCSAQVTVEAEFETNPCINQNWQPLTFTASAMWAVSVLTWEDNQGVDQVASIVEFCKVDLPSTHTKGLPYECQPEAF